MLNISQNKTVLYNYNKKKNSNIMTKPKTRKATGFIPLRLKYWEINWATPKCQIDFLTKLA